jgi:glycosyltransferase involved in cell wall biosynthesis
MKKKPFRILLVTKSTGGIAEYIRWLVQGIDTESYSLTVACLSENSTEFAAELRQKYHVGAMSYAMNRYKVDPLSDARLGLQLMRLLRSHRFDLVHAHGSKAGFLVRMAGLGTQIPILYTPHCFAFHAGTHGWKKNTVILLERFAAARTSRFITVSAGSKELALAHRVGKPEQFSVVHTGIEAEKYHPAANKKALKAALGIPPNAAVIGTVGRLNAQKSPLDFVRVAAASLKSAPETHFVWAGSGHLAEEARFLSERLGISSSVHWIGQRDDIPDLLQIFDCFLLVSRWEGFPLVILEAMAAEVPVVATDIPGTNEAISHGKNGWLAPVGEHEKLARYILDLLNNPQRAKDFVEASRIRLQNEFRRTEMLTKIQDVYDRYRPV